MIQWFKRHPAYLKDVSNDLANDLNYEQICQYRNKFFVSHGNIVVRLNQVHKFPVLILYTDATPYTLPEIYPLKDSLEPEQVELLSNMELAKLSRELHGHVRFYPYLRHQNASGLICIIEWDNLDTDLPFYGIKTILKRVKEWFAGTITGRFPAESAETELIGHFNNVDYTHYFLYDDELLNPAYVEGDAYGFLVRHLPATMNNGEKWIYFSGSVTGIDSSGLITNLGTKLPLYFEEMGYKDFASVLEDRGALNRKLDLKEVIKIFWFLVSETPAPFQHFDELVKIIGAGDEQAGRMRFHRFTYSELKTLPASFFIGLRFPHYREGSQFQLFQVEKRQDNTGILFNLSEEEMAAAFIENYQQVLAITCEKFTEADYYKRNSGRVDQGILRRKKIISFGVGALGSEVADCLSKAGVGELVLIDNQSIKAHNAVRHLCNIEDVGIPKSDAVANILRLHNPHIKIVSFAGSVFGIDFVHIHEDGIIISTIADDNTEAYINEQALLMNKTVFYARALRGGKTARIFRVIPRVDACMYCMQLYRKERRELLIIPEDLGLPTIKNECNNPIRPASAADLKLIASLASRILIDQMQIGFHEANHWIWTSESLGDDIPIQPFSLMQQTLKPHPDCFYCSHREKITVQIPESVLVFMQALVTEDNTIETGGVLAGRKDKEGNLVVQYASGPGLRAVRTATQFKKDVEFCQSFLDDLYILDNQIVYVGEWHSHPSNSNNPSGVDIQSLTQIANQPNYLTEDPVMIILSHDGGASCTVHPIGKTFYYANLIIT